MNPKVSTLNMFQKLFVFEVKRYFENLTLVIISCIVPILLIMTILGSLLPVFFKGAELNDIEVALFNEDDTFETNMIVRHLTESDSVEGFVDVIEVDSLSEGISMLDDNEVSALIHIPLNLQESLYQGESETLFFYAGNKDKQITKLLYDMLQGGLNNINQAQKSVDIIYYAMRDMGYDRKQAGQEYRDTSISLFTNIISRSDIYTDYNEVSATGDYLNIEYYLISTLLLSLFFLSLPICSRMSKDKLSGVMDRGGFYQSTFCYISAKILAGSLFLLLPAVMTTIISLAITDSFGLFSGSVALIVITLILSAIYFANIMASIGTHAKSTTAAIWIGFSVALIVSAISGIFIPRNLMPRGIVNVAEITGLPAVIRLYGSALFGIRNMSTGFDIIKVMGVSLIIFVLSYIKTRKRLLRL